MVEVSNNFIQECEANVGTYKFGKIKVNYIDDNPFNYEQGAYSSSNGAKIDAEQSIRYNKLVECKPNFKYKIELGNSHYKMKIVTYNANQAFIAAHDNLAEGSELTTESTAAYISVTIYSNDTLEGTAITLNSTIRNGEIAGAELQGNTSQNGTPTPDAPVEVENVTGGQVVRVCGKNLLDYSAFEKGRINSSTGKIEHADKVTNFSTTENTISFTATQAWNNGVASGFIPFRSGTYIIKGTITGQRSPVYVDYYNADKSWLSRYSNTNMPFNPGATTSYVLNLNNSNASYIRIHFEASTAGDVTITNLQLEKGSTATTFKKYQGKDYEINLGKNLLDQSKLRQGAFHGRGNVQSRLFIDSNYYISSGTYTFFSNFDTSRYRVGVNASTNPFPNELGGNIYDSGWKTNQRIVFTIQNSGYLGLSISTTNGTDNLTPSDMSDYWFMVCKGSYDNMIAFSPYFEPIELCKIGNYQDFIRKGTGKNVADTEKVNLGYTLNDDGSLRLLTNRTTLFQNLIKPNTQYSLSVASNYQIGNLFYYKEDKTFLSMVSSGWGNNKVITTPSEAYYISFATRVSTDATMVESDLANLHIQIEESSSVTYYEPYGYKDKWYIEKNVDKYILDKANTTSGKTYCNVNTTWDEQNEGYIHFQLPQFIVKYNDGDKIMIVDNRFPSVTIANRNLKAEQIFAHYSNGVVSITIETSRLNGITSSSSATEKRNAFNTWLTSNPITVYYVMTSPTYTLIENEELLNQLESASHAQTQEGISNILVSGNLPATLKVTPDLTESIRGKQTTPIVGYNITGDDDLINFKITSKADSNGNILGATSQSQVDIEIFNENNTHNLENKQVYISTGLAETEGNYCKWQPFTITQTKDTQTKNHTTYTGYDDMMRGNEAYIDNIDYGEDGITLYDFTCNLAKEMGMALENTTMTNRDFIVKGNNFTNNEAKLVVLKNVAQMAGGFAMIDRDNLLRIVELSPEDAMTPIELTTNLYTEDFQNSAKFGEINEFAIGETNIETNAIVRSDDASIAKNGVKKIEILDNMFLGILEDKETAIEPLWDAFDGFNYYPFKTPYNGYPYIDLGDKINITDINSNVYDTLVLNNVFEYNGGYKGNIGAEALSITAAKYKTNNTLSKQFRKVGIDIDRVEGKITSEIAAATDGITNAYNTAISQTEKNINLSVTEINKVLSGDPAVEGDTGLEGTVSKINQTYLAVDSEGFTAVSSTATEAKKKADAVEENTQKIVSQLHFDAETGLTISAEGSTDDDMKLNLTNSQVNFMYRNSPVLVINGNKIEFTGATFQKFDLGNYVWQAEDDDSLSLIYEGD